MVEIKLFYLLVFCALSAAAFLISALHTKSTPEEEYRYIIIPVTKETEDTEFIARRIVSGCRGKIRVILIDYGADREQFEIFEKATGGMIDYRIVKPDTLTLINAGL